MLFATLPIILSACCLAVPLFDLPADPQQLQQLHVEGLRNPVPGTVYPAGALEDGGMPLGAIGTGYLCLDTDGRIGKTSIFNRYPAPMPINQPFLAVTFAGKQYTVATPKDGVGDAKAVHYFGHFPVADARFEFDAPFRIEIRAFTPFIPGDATESNTPAAVFRVAICNLVSEPREAALAITLPGFPKGETLAFSENGWTGMQVTHPAIERMPDWVRHTYALAAANGTAESIDAGIRVSCACDLQANETRTVDFVLAWHQPWLRDGSNRVEKHLYAERFADAKAVALHAIGQRERWLGRVLAWQDAIYGADLPGWLKETLVNAPYDLAKNSLWLTPTRPDDWWGKAGLFLVNESFATCSVSETMPCRFFGHWPALFFFPELERSTLGAIRYFQLRGGEPPFCFGMGFSIRDPRYHCQHTCGAGEYAQMIYRYYLRTGDAAFLKDFWTSARDAVNFMLWLDKDGDGLVEDHPHAFKGETFPANNPLDNWPWYGASSYTAGKGLATLVCGIKMADLAGDAEQARQWCEVLAHGQRSYEEKLWTGEFYRISSILDQPRSYPLLKTVIWPAPGCPSGIHWASCCSKSCLSCSEPCLYAAGLPQR